MNLISLVKFHSSYSLPLGIWDWKCPWQLAIASLVGSSGREYWCSSECTIALDGGPKGAALISEGYHTEGTLLLSEALLAPCPHS